MDLIPMILICGTKGSTKRVDDQGYVCPVCAGNTVRTVQVTLTQQTQDRRASASRIHFLYRAW
jgi:hypothetical protein